MWKIDLRSGITIIEIEKYLSCVWNHITEAWRMFDISCYIRWSKVTLDQNCFISKSCGVFCCWLLWYHTTNYNDLRFYIYQQRSRGDQGFLWICCGNLEGPGCSTWRVDNAIHWITQLYPVDTAVRFVNWIAIHPLDSFIRLLYNWAQLC